jgi:CRP/FNR family transcriptional regulator, polysaccharide utilization system transcription regulator
MEHYLDTTQTNCTFCCRKSPLFQWLTEEELELIKLNKQTIKFNTGETIRKQGTSMTHVISLNSGLGKLYIEGKEQNAILRIVKPTSFIGGPGMYLDQVHHFTITALTDSIICFIELNVFKEIISRNEKFFEEFMKEISRSTLAVYNRLIFFTQKQSPGRMADTLLYLADDIFEGLSFPMVLTRQDLAELSAMSKDSAVKVLRQFQEEELIRITSSTMEILSRDALLRISKTG